MARIGVMAVLTGGMLFPLLMIHGLVAERAARAKAAGEEVSSQWGRAQVIGGPVLSVEFRTAAATPAGTPRVDTDRAVYLPSSLLIEGTVVPETRRRGLFEVVVYRSMLKFSGRFTAPDFTPFGGGRETANLATARIAVALSDPRGLSGPVRLIWNGQGHSFVPGTPYLALGMAGVSAGVPLPEAGTDIPFEVMIEVSGTKELRFLPFGNNTVVNLSSPWRHPSFTGAPLPQQRNINSAGFTANWSVPYYGRNYPALWSARSINQDSFRQNVTESSFGVILAHPVDIYQQSERAVKYAVLFIVMTFVVAFLWEIIHGVLVHPVQYLFIGFAMCVFYLLLLALSEHLSFDIAYVVGALANVALIAWYWVWVSRGGFRHGLLMGLALSLLYGYLYLLLRLEDYALVAGAVGLFAMLAGMMFLTRRVDWYTLRLGNRADFPAA